MSRGDFGYGSTSEDPRTRRPPNWPEYRDNPFPGYVDFNDLYDQVSSNIFQINSNATVLDRSTRQIGSPKDSPQLRDRIHTTEQATNSVINTTAGSLKQLSAICQHAERPQRLQFERLKNEFQDTVKRYHTLQKNVAEKVKSAAPLSRARKGGSGPGLISWDDDDRSALLQQEDQRRQMQAQEQVIETDVALLVERENQIQQLEHDILDINEIFRDLGTLVHEQGEVIDSIENNVEAAYDDVQAGNEQLVQASKYQKKARKKICFLVICLVVLAGIIALVIYFSIKGT